MEEITQWLPRIPQGHDADLKYLPFQSRDLCVFEFDHLHHHCIHQKRRKLLSPEFSFKEGRSEGNGEEGLSKGSDKEGRTKEKKA